MDDFDVTPYLPRNPATQARHRREVLWQVTLPVVGVVILLLVAAVLVSIGLDRGQASRWGDISLIFLIFPAMFMALLGLAVLGGLVYLHLKLIAKLPPFFYRLQNLFLQANLVVERTTDKLVEPVIRVKSFKASVDALRGRGQGRKTRR